MMRIKLLIAAFLFAILGSPLAAIASDVSGALFSGTVLVSNNSTATTNVATTANISTDTFIAHNFLNATANNTVMRNSSGSDVAFMPGYTDANLWCMWVPSIGDNGYLTYILYTANSTGGKIRYFPGPTGMTTVDEPGLELLGWSTNFSIVQSGWADTTSTNTSTVLVYKDEAIITYVGSGNITSGIWAQENRPIDDTPLTWVNPERSYDNDLTTYASNNINDPGTTDFITYDVEPAIATNIRGYYDWSGAGGPWNSVDVDAYYDGAWQDVFNGAIGGFLAWHEYDLGGEYFVNAIRFRFTCGDGGDPPNTTAIYLIEAQIGSYYPYVTASSVTSDEHTIETTREPEPAMALWAADVNVGVNMGNGILPVKILEEQTLTAAAASVTFSDIGTKKDLWDALAGVESRHLVVMVNAATTGALGFDYALIRYNGDAGANYNYQNLVGAGAVPSAAVTTGTNQAIIVTLNGTVYANALGGGIAIIPHAFNTSNHKATLSFSGAVEHRVETSVSRWADTSAITDIEIFISANNFATGSSFILGVIDERYLVEEQLLAADGVIDFNNIPQTGDDLVMVGYARSDRAATQDLLVHEINTDAVAANYARQFLRGQGAVATALQGNDMLVGYIIANNAGVNEFGAVVATYSQYAEGTNDPHVLALTGYHESTLPDSYVNAMSGRRNNVVAITRLEYYPNTGVNFKAGSLFSLYRVPRYVISRQELTAATPTITFDNIPQNYQAFQLNVYARSDDAIPISDDVAITLNTDAVAANYDFQELTGTGAVVAAARNAASQVLMTITAAGEGANEFGGGVTTFNQYTNTLGHKHFITLSGTNENQVILRSSRWEDLPAITRIDLDPVNGANFIAGSVFELVGLMPTQVLDIDVDGEIKGLADGNIIVPDTADDWVFVEAAAMPYMEYHRITINGTLQQSIEWEYDTTFHDRSYYGVEFDGVDDLIDCGAGATLELSSGTGTFELWINTTEANTRDFMVKGAAAPYYLFRIQNDGTIFVQLFDGANQLRSISVGTIDDGGWHHIVATFVNGTSCNTYIDGVDDSSAQLTGTLVGFNPAGSLTFGQGVLSGGFIDATVDEVRVYNRALGLAEIQANYNSGVGIYTPSDTTGLVGWWHMEEGTGVTTADSSGNGNTGTLTNDPRWVNGIVPLPFGTSGTNDAIPSFRTASSDPDVSANLTSFSPVSEAKAPPYVLGATVPFLSDTSGNVTGNFTTVPAVPPAGSFPLAGVIAAVANATGTPPQLPLMIIACFIIFAASFTNSYYLRKFGSGSIIIKSLVIIGVMGIFIGLKDWGIDFWMLVVVAVMATALCMASRQQGWQ